MNSRNRIHVSEPWRIKPMSLAEAHLVLDHSNVVTAKEFFDRIQIKGQVAMLLGGGRCRFRCSHSNRRWQIGACRSRPHGRQAFSACLAELRR
jgi:hypothetical protein